MQKKYRFSIWVGVLVVLSLMFGNGNYNTGTMAYAEDGVIPMHVPTSIELPLAKPSQTWPLAAEGQPWSSSGWFNIVWGDGQDGTAETIYTLTYDSGQITPLLLDETLSQSLGGVLWFDRKKVNVAGVWAISFSAQGTEIALNVTSISLAPLPETGALSGDVSPAVTGSKPWVTIMCKFNDYTNEPENLAYFTGMYSSTKPGLDHYWRELSYDTANVAGSNALGWFALPQPEAYYNPTDTLGGTNLGLLATDCIAAADASVNYSLYSGINMMFNTDFDNGYAWGGSRYMTLDGVTKSWNITWEPPWGYDDITVIAHEMGHGFGLPHSSGAYGQTYDNVWDVMSDAWTNCNNSTDPTYGCLGQHTISYHKDRLGWISAGQKFTAASGSSTTITLEQLALPDTANYKMAQIPIGGSSTHFYTVEARRLIGYDVKLAGAAVIIHEVDTTRSRPAYVVDSDLNGETNDAGAMWVVGETFTDIPNNISVTVLSATSTGFQVTIINNFCTYYISPSSSTVGKASGTGSVSVTASASCSWTSESNAAWITVTSGSSGTGNGIVNYSYTANNSGSSRQGTVTIAGQTFTLRQRWISISLPWLPLLLE